MQAVAHSIGKDTARVDCALLRRLFSLLLIISIFWISYVAQTHIHGRPVGSVPATISKIVTANGGIAPTAPANNDSDDSSTCPLCQAIALGAALLLPLLLVFLALERPAQIVHFWTAGNIEPNFLGYRYQTRGPPTL